MNKLVTIATFTTPTDVAVIKGKLESEGISCFVQNELTVQVHNFYSNAIGGIDLQVDMSDVAKAIVILKEAGYSVEPANETYNYVDRYNAFSRELPLIGGMKFEVRALLILVGVILFSTAVISWFVLPSTDEKLVGNHWCTDKITINREEYKPNSLGIRFVLNGGCEEELNFEENGKLSIPGISTNPIKGRWVYGDGIITISNLDTLSQFYEGQYKVVFTESQLELTSAVTTIKCYKSRY